MNRDVLLALLLAAYALSEDDIRAMATAIAAGYLASMRAAYREASETVGSSDDWTPDDDEQEQAHEWATEQAENIADTYKHDLEAALLLFLDTWQKEQGSLDGALQAAPMALGTWTKARAEWKAEQISNYSCGSGADAGTNAFLDDVQDMDVVDTAGEVVDMSGFGVAILPDASSSDFCKEYAGKVYTVEEYQDMGISWPAHPSCIHEAYFVEV